MKRFPHLLIRIIPMTREEAAQNY